MAGRLDCRQGGCTNAKYKERKNQSNICAKDLFDIGLTLNFQVIRMGILGSTFIVVSVPMGEIYINVKQARKQGNDYAIFIGFVALDQLQGKFGKSLSDLHETYTTQSAKPEFLLWLTLK